MADPVAPDVRPPAASADAGLFSSHAFIVGSARSGTTWTQLLLTQHPRIASSPETHVFSRYLGRLMKEYDEDAARERRRGITRHLTREDMLGVCAAACERLMARIAARSPGADVLLQKVPDVGGDVGLIRALFPAARFVHVIRDPRAVVASLVAGSTSWAKEWAPGGAARAARLWRDAVETSLTIPGTGAPYLEIRYEDLHAKPDETLAAVHAFLGLASDAESRRAAFAACRIEDLRERRAVLRAPWDVNSQREGFFRKGETDAWRGELSKTDVRRVERSAWELMGRLAYVPVFRRRPRGSLRVWAHRKVSHFARQLGRGGERLSRFLDRHSP